MHKALANELTTERLLSPGEAVVVGVSGGPDSMALLHVLLELNQRLDWNLRLHAAHLNHQLRGTDAERDEAFVRAAADSLSLPCTIETRDIAELATRDSGGIEEVSRRERYALFERVCLQTGSKVIAVGHQADDNAETVLFRVLRGTGLRGLAGIPRSRPLSPGSDVRIIRPLLRRTRQAILAYLSDAGIAYREDRSNLGDEAMRNRIRNALLPKIESEFNPQARDALTRLAEQASWLEEYLRETVQRTFETLIVSRTDQELILNAAALSRKSRIVQAEIIRLAHTSFGLGEQDVSFVHLVSALDLVTETVSGKQTQLPGGMTVQKRYGQLIFSLPREESREDIASEVAVHVPGITSLPLRKIEIDCEHLDAAPADIVRFRKAASRFEEYVDLDAVHLPLVVRGRKPGERFTPLGAPGTKKLSEFLSDTKVGPEERERVAVLCDHLGPIWIIGHRLDDRAKLTELTRKVLRLRVRRLDR
jgi:tRNA(Ile)-lysidine synthase